MTYRRIEGIPDGATVQSTSSEEAGLGPANRETHSQDDSVNEEMYHYTRVQILTQIHLSSQSEGGFADNLNEVREGSITIATERVNLKNRDKSELAKLHPMFYSHRFCSLDNGCSFWICNNCGYDGDRADTTLWCDVCHDLKSWFQNMELYAHLHRHQY